MNWRRLALWRPRAWLAARQGWRHLAVVLAAGALSATAMAPLHFWPALAVGLCVLVWSLDGARRHPKRTLAGFLRGFVFGFGYFLAGTYWIAFAFLTRGEGYGFMVPVAVPAFAAMLAVFWGMAGVLQAWIAPRLPWRVLVLAAVLTVTEWLRGHLFGGLPWNLPGYAWPAGGAVSQAAAWFGIYGLSFLTVFALASPAAAIGRPLRLSSLAPVIAGAAIGMIVLCGGALRLSGADAGYQPDIRLRLVHADIPQRAKWAPGGAAMTRDRYLELTAEPGLADVTHVIWPEGALPVFMLEDDATLALIGQQLRAGQTLVAGINRRADTGNGEYAYYNALVGLRFPNGSPRVESLYDKVRLTPFSEIVPLTGLLRAVGLDEFARYQFTPGPGATTLELPGAPPVMPLICYEAIFPGFVHAVADRPAWLLNISNDAWFGVTAGPRQHFNQARYRAIETGVPMIRSAARGVSGVVDAHGRTRVEIPPGEEGVRDVNLPRPVGVPLYGWWGDVPVWIVVLTILAGVLILRRRAVARLLSTRT